MPTVAHWPIDITDIAEFRRTRNPWVSLARDSIDHYRTGQADRVRRLWDDEIAWTVDADGRVAGTWTGPDAVFDYHRLLERVSHGTFRQRLVALESSGGPIVECHVRTSAARRGGRLDIPSLLVFEFAGGLLSRVTEIPGDRRAWAHFWAD
ncbi:MAG TPA: hypothetical protein VFV72_04210 [Candidatus Limnocylindrales bacterium]|nr:hypothetical protein [Candidatus Limnocylindrales bacterium]